jgi:hypothetical protein
MQEDVVKSYRETRGCLAVGLVLQRSYAFVRSKIACTTISGADIYRYFFLYTNYNRSFIIDARIAG